MPGPFPAFPMITQEQLLALNFSTWLELYIFIHEQDITGPFVRISAPGVQSCTITEQNTTAVLDESETFVIEMKELKALAFDEVFHRIPAHNTILVIQELLMEIAHRAHTTPDHIVTFLNNLPTRTKCK